jgi:hypothetical protein
LKRKHDPFGRGVSDIELLDAIIAGIGDEEPESFARRCVRGTGQLPGIPPVPSEIEDESPQSIEVNDPMIAGVGDEDVPLKIRGDPGRTTEGALRGRKEKHSFIARHEPGSTGTIFFGPRPRNGERQEENRAQSARKN